ncbi:hypothetical protein J4732_03890 [Serratia marcescens]|uniref:Uncharacterized protein n=1 Tax=Serratia marcescens TaxID=615 RepID=A0A939NNN7_SERMA|nr:hypothetical protein [Serratia marcescens]
MTPKDAYLIRPRSFRHHPAVLGPRRARQPYVASEMKALVPCAAPSLNSRLVLPCGA